MLSTVTTVISTCVSLMGKQSFFTVGETNMERKFLAEAEYDGSMEEFFKSFF